MLAVVARFSAILYHLFAAKVVKFLTEAKTSKVHTIGTLVNTVWSRGCCCGGNDVNTLAT